MIKTEFEQWLLKKYDAKTASSRKSNCLRVEQFEGDLDNHFDTDKCYGLLKKLTYTKDDENNDRIKKHNIPINGNVYNGTSTFKQAVNLYSQFRHNNSNHKNIQAKVKKNAFVNKEQKNNIEDILFNTHVQDNIKDSVEYKEVENIAFDFLDYLNSIDIKLKINENNKIDASSAEIQNIFIEKLIELGFSSEKNNLFNEYNKKLRPDYYKSLSANTGIIIEIERGRTLHNNMDLLDIWKCHICDFANYLFLVVPKYRFDRKGGKITVFKNVDNRIKCFFEQKNYINVDGIFLFGY